MVFEVVFGPDFELDQKVSKIETCLRDMSRQPVTLRKILDEKAGSKGCKKVMALLGTGIVLWDQASMLMFQEDPFTSMTSIEVWARNMGRVHIPRFVRVMER